MSSLKEELDRVLKEQEDKRRIGIIPDYMKMNRWQVMELIPPEIQEIIETYKLSTYEQGLLFALYYKTQPQPIDQGLINTFADLYLFDNDFRNGFYYGFIYA